jgi:hypothetical protein
MRSEVVKEVLTNVEFNVFVLICILWYASFILFCVSVLIKMDDFLDEFIPLTGISQSPKKKNSISQVSSTSRLSRSYIKSKKKSGCGSKSTSGNKSCHSSTVGSVTTSRETYQNRETCPLASGVGVQFCPICQAPFDIIKVEPCVHVNQCNMTSSELEGNIITNLICYTELEVMKLYEPFFAYESSPYCNC